MIHPVEELTAYLDGALAAGDRERVAEHLDRCASCRAEHQRLAAATSALRRLAVPPAVSPTFEQRFYARLATEKQAPPRTIWDRLGLRGPGAWRWLAPGLAGVAAAAVVLVYTGGRHHPDDGFLASHLDLFENYEEVASMGAIDRPEDVQVVAHLHELRRTR